MREKGRGGGRRGCVRGRGGGRRGVNKEIEGTGEEHYSTYRLLHSRKLSRMQKFETVSKDFFGSHPYTAREASPEKDFPCEIFSLRNLSVQFAKVCILRRFTTIRQTQPSLPAPPTSSTHQLHLPGIFLRVSLFRAILSTGALRLNVFLGTSELVLVFRTFATGDKTWHRSNLTSTTTLCTNTAL